jgi:hypothetical protein
VITPLTTPRAEGCALKPHTLVGVELDHAPETLRTGGNTTMGSLALVLTLLLWTRPRSPTPSTCNQAIRSASSSGTNTSPHTLPPVPCIVLGDYNRWLIQPNDRAWADLDDGEPANADLAMST